MHSEISILVAFLGGVISLFSPCSAMVIPVFVATATANKSATILRTTALFSLGLITSMLPLALGALVLSRFFLSFRPQLTLIIGLFLVLSSLFILFLDYLPFPDIRAYILDRFSSKSLTTSTFFLGIISGLGATTCIGPILGAIVSLAAANTNPIIAPILMLSYAAGIMLPLTIITLTYHHYGKKLSARIKSSHLKIGRYDWNLTQLITVALLLFVAYVFIVHQGSLSNIRLLNNSQYFNATFDLQSSLFKF